MKKKLNLISPKSLINFLIIQNQVDCLTTTFEDFTEKAQMSSGLLPNS